MVPRHRQDVAPASPMKKKLIIIVVLLLLLGGGGGGAWWFLMKDNEEVDLKEVASSLTRRVPEFVELDPLIVPVIREGKVAQHLTLSIIVEVDSPSEKDLIITARRQLLDGYLTELHALFSHKIVQNNPDPIPLLRKRLLEVSHRLLGQEVVDQVLVTVIDAKKIVSG